ncbi:MAG TPA: class I tRNA ligase family protein [Candidatus Saccharimonadales bacterium]|nr:class I tRNA ligase family protein [Candidatus Saccharimonadales bacterium]
MPTQDDGDFTWEKFEAAYNNELANELGNLVSRVAKMINSYQAGVIGDAIKSEHDAAIYHDAIKDLEFNKAMDEVWLMVRGLNQYLEEVKPWQVAKTRDKDAEAESHLGEILAHSVGTLLQIAALLDPFLPTTAKAINDIFSTGVVKLPEGVMFEKKYLHTADPRANSDA